MEFLSISVISKTAIAVPHELEIKSYPNNVQTVLLQLICNKHYFLCMDKLLKWLIFFWARDGNRMNNICSMGEIYQNRITLF
jgi:hypothetical protein